MPQLRSDSPIVSGTKRTFVDLIRRFRVDHGLTQRQLAERLSVDEAIVSRVLSGDLSRFSIERLMKYAGELYPQLVVSVGLRERQVEGYDRR